MARRFVNLFALWIAVASVLAFFFPHPLGHYTFTIVPLLGIVMLGMGVTLEPRDFRNVLREPKAVFVGSAAQFLFMPFLGWAIAKALRLPPELAVGQVLVGACPGGTASNVLTFLAGGDVALAVTLTGVTTVLAPILTPSLTYLYAHTWVDVPVWGLLQKTVQIVLVPVFLGVLLRRLSGRRQDALVTWMPVVSVCGIVFIVSVIVASNHQTMRAVGGTVVLAAALHNLLGMVLGYTAARLFRLPPAQVRAIALEVAVQDSGLGVALAASFFGKTAALPSAVFSVWQNLSGPVAAWLFRRSSRQ